MRLKLLPVNYKTSPLAGLWLPPLPSPTFLVPLRQRDTMANLPADMLKRFQQMRVPSEFSNPNRFSPAAVDEVNEEESTVWLGCLVGKFYPPVSGAFNVLKTAAG